MEESWLETEAVGIMECAEDDPDSFVTALFREHLVQEDESLLGDTFWRDGGGVISLNSLFDVFKVILS